MWDGLLIWKLSTILCYNDYDRQPGKIIILQNLKSIHLLWLGCDLSLKRLTENFRIFTALWLFTTSYVIHICQAIHATLHRPEICPLHIFRTNASVLSVIDSDKQMIFPFRLWNIPMDRSNIRRHQVASNRMYWKPLCFFVYHKIDVWWDHTNISQALSAYSYIHFQWKSLPPKAQGKLPQLKRPQRRNNFLDVSWYLEGFIQVQSASTYENRNISYRTSSWIPVIRYLRQSVSD